MVSIITMDYTKEIMSLALVGGAGRHGVLLLNHLDEGAKGLMTTDCIEL